MKKSIWLVVVSIFVSSANAVAAEADLQPVAICRPNNMVSALLFIADSKGYFTAEGLAPKFETATNAKICQDLLIAGKVDYMCGAEGPFTYLAASKPPVKILAMLGEDPETAIFGRKDRGITQFADLKGKRIGYLPGTVSYFFLGRVLKHSSLSRTDVKLASMQPPTMPQALSGGSIDAFSMWEPWGAQAKSLLGENLIHLEAPDIYQFESLLTAREDALSSSPIVPEKVLRALIHAEEFIRDHNEEAFTILSKAIAFEENSFRHLWPKYKHHVRLESQPIELMKENFALLREDDENFKGSDTPDFASHVASSYLRKIDPARVQDGF